MCIFILLIFFVLGLLCIPTSTAFGISPCVYSGSFDESGTNCLVLPMPVSTLPLQCTSFIYDGLLYVNGSDFNPPSTSITNMNNLRNSGKKLFLIYTHGSLTQWMSSLDNQSVTTEIEKLSSFLKINPAAGIILKDLDYNYDANLPFHVDPYLYSDLKDYIVYMKKSIPAFNIGLYINASSIISHNCNPTSQDFFDFAVLNDAVDNYIIGFDGFNPCNDEFRSGVVPLCGPKSLMTFADALNSLKIATNKIYLEFSVNPTSNTAENMPICGISYQKICEDTKYRDTWCADNSDSLYFKGRFAKEKINAQGIAVKYIDAIDPTGVCNCDNKNQFITFQMMLRGFTQSDPITDCSVINDLTKVECSDDDSSEHKGFFSKLFHK